MEISSSLPSGIKTRGVDALRSANYRRRADEFFQAMKTEEEKARYNAAALLGVHASIALTDALTVREAGKRAADEEHREATKLLKTVCRQKKVADDGSERLGRILAHKTDIAYGEHFVAEDSDRLKAIRLNAERFFLWARRSFPHVWASPHEGG